VEIEGPGEGEVLVEVRAAGLCHSDLSVVAGLRRRQLPVVGGHEGAGVVRAVGAGVTEVRPGDHVVMTVVAACGHCRYCYDARPALCDSASGSRNKGLLANGHRRLTCEGVPTYHYSAVSSFAQYAVVTPPTLVKIDPSVPLDVAAMFGCAVVTGAGCVFNTARVQPGQSVAVLGLGGVGFNAVMAARIAGASQIIGIDINEAKFPLARELGCTHTFSALAPDLVANVRDLAKGGVDYAFEISGARPAMATAFGILCKGGEVIAVGLGATTDLYQYPHAVLVGEQKSIRGSMMGSGPPGRDIPRYIGMFQDGRMPVDRLKSGTMGFDELNRCLDLLDQGSVVRQILLPHGAA
jgi:alcohol dehydrogenase